MFGGYFLGRIGGKMDVTHKIFRDQPDFIEDSTAPWQQLVDEDIHFKVFLDRYPVTPGHLLFVPKYNTLSVLQEVFDAAVRKGKTMVETGECNGFNIGMNYGDSAGQTVGWPHVHLIPRRTGDMEDPTGGVRYVIPERGNYKNDKSV